jgi:very-short-patch-repair endonuclease
MDTILLLLLFLGFLALVIFLSGKLRALEVSDRASAYTLKPSVLTPAELAFFKVLEGVLPDGVKVWPKVRWIDFLNIRLRGDGRQAALNRVVAKHVDFLLVDAETARPLLVIELDDESHDREDRQERDRFLEAVMEHVGLPLARVRVRKRYSPAEIRALVESHLPGLPCPGQGRGAS